MERKQFDAVKEKRTHEKKSKQKRKIGLLEIYPVKGITLKDHVIIETDYQRYYAVFFEVKKYDLNLLDEDETATLTNGFWNFLKQYNGSVKEIYMNFPENNYAQQKYLEHKIAKAMSSYQLNRLRLELDKLKFIENGFDKNSSYLVIYGKTESELNMNIKKFQFHTQLYHSRQLEQATIKKILTLQNNRGGIK
ncbi:hypothetical protein AF435_04505 [Listeria monocytogenes]|uniref:Uncharacterized protein n=1 Tax=Listeria monocytogenes TaxID=1639 RepID=A0AAN2WEY9_LISMN|nr:hypothetical protein [Listeria monocytogenes]EAC3367752.1 hypothetical protein [Listeria monocytogenes]EAC7084981.1 hypothetical protein [Listeria monocytogenes]EAC8542007.1 hypothetical protein [Listeria monocytogenes]EAC8548008.1 hypothetical protein [Listeria monocytogenes]